MAFPSLPSLNRASGREALGQLRIMGQGNLGVPIFLMILLGMMILPVPPLILDVLFSFNIALSIVVLLVGVYALRPLDFASFPTILLVATLLRLALNVASTRVVLLYGHEGPAAAGKVIQALDRKSTRLNSSHVRISYAVFCLKKKKTTKTHNN